VNFYEKLVILACSALFGAFVVVLTFGERDVPRPPISGPSCSPIESNRQQPVAQGDVRNGWSAEPKNLRVR